MAAGSKRGGICIWRQLHVVVEINDHRNKRMNLHHSAEFPALPAQTQASLYSVCVSQSSCCSVCLTPVYVFPPSSSQSIISEGGRCSSFQENAFSSSQHVPTRFRISKFSVWVTLSSTCRCLVRWYQTWQYVLYCNKILVWQKKHSTQ